MTIAHLIAMTTITLGPPTPVQSVTAAAVSGWSPEVVVALLVGVVGAVLALASLVLQGFSWRRDGPLVRAEIFPATEILEAIAVGVHMEDLGDLGLRPLLVVRIYSTGRQPVYISGVTFETVQPLKGRRWRRPGYGQRAVYVPGEASYVGASRPGRIEAADQLNLVYALGPIKALAEVAHMNGHPDEVRAVVAVGAGATVRTKPYSLRRPPLGAFEDIREVGEGEHPTFGD